MDRLSVRRWLPILLAAILAGCASRLRERAETVFVRHNAVSSALMLTLPDLVDERRIEDLEAAEAAMIQACADLDRAVEAHRDGQPVGSRRAVLASLDACEESTLRLERLLALEIPAG